MTRGGSGARLSSFLSHWPLKQFLEVGETLLTNPSIVILCRISSMQCVWRVFNHERRRTELTMIMIPTRIVCVSTVVTMNKACTLQVFFLPLEAPVRFVHCRYDFAQPLSTVSFCPDNTILIEFSSKFAPPYYQPFQGVPPGKLVRLTPPQVNQKNSSMKSVACLVSWENLRAMRER